MYIKVARSRDVKLPVRGHAHDAGMDFFVPNMDSKFIDDFNSKEQNEGISLISKVDERANVVRSHIVLKPGQGAMIPTGVHTEIPIGYMGIFQNKSGVATKKRLLVGAQVVDTYYDGEVHINVHNVSDRDVIINEGEKLSQMVMIPIVGAHIIEVEKEDLYTKLREEDLRGDGGFGSTDK